MICFRRGVWVTVWSTLPCARGFRGSFGFRRVIVEPLRQSVEAVGAEKVIRASDLDGCQILAGARLWESGSDSVGKAREENGSSPADNGYVATNVMPRDMADAVS
jgi:hypothetical protein